MCSGILLLGIFLYLKSINAEKDSNKLRNSGYKNNFNIYLKNKALMLIFFSSIVIIASIIRLLINYYAK
jgi:hypothetical protein